MTPRKSFATCTALVPSLALLTGLFALMLPGSARAQWQADPPADGSAHAAARSIPREEMLESLRQGLFPSPATPPAPGYEVLSKEDAGDHERWRIRWVIEDGETAPAYLLVPKRNGIAVAGGGARLPLVLALHGTTPLGKDRSAGLHAEVKEGEAPELKYLNREYGLQAVRRGYVVFAPDREAYGERRPLVKGTVKQQMDEATRRLQARHPGWTLFAKQLWDMQRALDFLVTLDFVDPARIASIGHSLGAWDSVLLGAMDERVRAVIISHCGSLRYLPGIWRDEAALRAYLDLNAKRPQAINTNLNIYLMLLAPRSQLFFWSIEEPKDAPPNLIEALRLVSDYNRRVAKDAGRALDFSFYLHTAGHDFPPDSRALAWEWLAMRLQ